MADKKKDDKNDDYDPFAERDTKYPTKDWETLVHLLKGSLGSGILAMAWAFKQAGMWFGLFATIVVGFLCAYAIHILVSSAHILCRRRRVPKMSYADVAEYAFRGENVSLHKFAWVLRQSVNAFLVLDLVACCCIYMVFVARTLKQVDDIYFHRGIDVRWYVLLITIPLIFMCLVRNLKYLVPFSFVANILLAIGLIITMVYVFSGLGNSGERYAITHISKWPLFFGTVIFALECVGVVMSLENDMENPTHFTGFPSVLVIAFAVVILLYIIVGFFGYWRYGDLTSASLTLNLPYDQWSAILVKLMVALVIFLTFTLQFYVPLNVIWTGIKDRIPEQRQNLANYALRVVLVIFIAVIAIAAPHLGPFISLIGAVCLSALGLIIPPIIEIAVFHEEGGFGKLRWILWKDIGLIIFGLVGLFTGAYMSIIEFRDEFATGKE